MVDLSGAWRLKQAAEPRRVWFEDKDPQLAAKLDRTAVFGLPELHRNADSRCALVANPGCYATSVIVPLTALVRAGLWMRHAV